MERLFIAIFLIIGMIEMGCHKKDADCTIQPYANILPDPIGHAVDVHARPWTTELAPDARLIPSPLHKYRDPKGDVYNSSKTMLAYIMKVGPQRQDMVFLHCITTNKTLAVEGIPLPWRPISDLAWANDRYLVFDRWSQPHHGMHYIIDTRKMQVAHATPFPDEFELNLSKSD